MAAGSAPSSSSPHESTSRRRLWLRLAPLGALAGAAVFPHAWLGERWPVFGRFMDWAFQGTRGHVFGHSLIFGVLGMALLWVFEPLRRRWGVYLGCILAGGLLQEGAQLVLKQRGPGPDELFDLGVDLSAGLVVWLVVRLALWARRGDANG